MDYSCEKKKSLYKKIHYSMLYCYRFSCIKIRGVNSDYRVGFVLCQGWGIQLDG